MNGRRCGTTLSAQAAERLPAYLQYLKQVHAEDVKLISSAKVAAHFELSEAQVRKDFAALCPSGGRPRSGFRVLDLLDGIESYLGVHSTNEAAIAGVGGLGRALLSFAGFQEYGLKISMAFDADPQKVGSVIGGVTIQAADAMTGACRDAGLKIGIITVPAERAQNVCDQMVECGIKAIWNFAPVHLVSPEGILIRNENLAASLAILSKHLRDSMEYQNEEKTEGN